VKPKIKWFQCFFNFTLNQIFDVYLSISSHISVSVTLPLHFFAQNKNKIDKSAPESRRPSAFIDGSEEAGSAAGGLNLVGHG
jgi:hypothetical protein